MAANKSKLLVPCILSGALILMAIVGLAFALHYVDQLTDLGLRADANYHVNPDRPDLWVKLFVSIGATIAFLALAAVSHVAYLILRRDPKPLPSPLPPPPG
jgi:uncharacterized BrkB/YihY/UPF0761 family membrane protein